MYGNGKKKHCKDAGLYNRFQRMKGIRGPRRWINRFVVHQVQNAEQLFVMHDAVRPVEVGIVQQQHQRKRQEKIQPSMRFDVRVQRRVNGNSRYVQYR